MNLAFEIAGVKFHKPEFTAANVQRGDTIELVPEPDNKYDPNAVKVIKEGHHIGYIPRLFTSDVLSLIEQGVKTATIETAWPDGCSIVFDQKLEESDGK